MGAAFWSTCSWRAQYAPPPPKASPCPSTAGLSAGWRHFVVSADELLQQRMLCMMLLSVMSLKNVRQIVWLLHHVCCRFDLAHLFSQNWLKVGHVDLHVDVLCLQEFNYLSQSWFTASHDCHNLTDVQGQKHVKLLFSMTTLEFSDCGCQRKMAKEQWLVRSAQGRRQQCPQFHWCDIFLTSLHTVERVDSTTKSVCQKISALDLAGVGVKTILCLHLSGEFSAQVLAFSYRIHPCIRRTFLSQILVPKAGRVSCMAIRLLYF